MVRVVATLTFWLTLFCPVFCLADTDGCCTDQCQPASRNCEAMTVGAVVAETTEVPATCSLCLPLPFDLFGLAFPLAADASRWPSWATRERSAKAPPSASIRQARLQLFLF